MSDLWNALGDLVNRPFFLALFTAVVLNGLTRVWSDRKEALRIKTELVAEMSETATIAFLAGDQVFGAPGASLGNASGKARLSDKQVQGLADAAMAWEKHNAVIGTKFEAYFRSDDDATGPDRRPGPGLTRRAASSARNCGIPEAWEYLGVALASWLKHERTDRDKWSDEQTTLKRAKAVLIRRVLDERMRTFEESWFPGTRALLTRIRPFRSGKRKR